MTKQQHSASEDGFTLVELLVALFVFALVASLSASFLYQSIESKKTIEVRSGKLQEIRVARALLKMDMLHVVHRPTRGRYGEAAQQSFAAGPPKEGQPFLTFVRGAAGNPGAFLPKPELQHVSYLIKEKKLIRRTRARLDPAAGTPVAEQVILTGVSDLKIEFFVGGFWQSRLGANLDGGVPFPKAVSVEISGAPYGTTKHSFIVAAGGVL